MHNEVSRYAICFGPRNPTADPHVPTDALFGSHGRSFLFDPDGHYTFANIHVGHCVSLSDRPVLMAALSEIQIGNRVMFGPEVTVIGGGHNTTVVGRFMTDVHEKTGNEDLGVVIEDDVWVGARAVIPRGVTAISRFAELDPERRHAMGMAGRRRAESLFTLESCVRRYEELLASAAHARGSITPHNDQD